MSTLGVVPGIILIIFFGLLTSYGSYVLVSLAALFLACIQGLNNGYDRDQAEGWLRSDTRSQLADTSVNP